MTSSFEVSQKEIELGRKLFASECEFIAGVDNLGAMIGESLPEIAFAGRSNVGKSSLINALTRRNSLARTSHTPGRTQQINFFDLGHQMHVVDLPGYGFARASKQKIANWNELIRLYLKGRTTLRRVCVLIDSRHGVKELDNNIMTLLDDSAVSYQVILTKIDKISKEDLEKVHEQAEGFLLKHPAAFPKIHCTSSAKGDGVPELRASLTTLIQD